MTSIDQRRDTTPQVTFHDNTHHDGPATNYHAHTASNEMATLTHPTHQAVTQQPIVTPQTHVQHSSNVPITQHGHTNSAMLQPINNTYDNTSSRRNSYQDDAVINKTTQLYAATPRSACDSGLIRVSYLLGAIGAIATFAWLITLLIIQCWDYELNNDRNYNIILQPFLYQLPYFFACAAFMFMAGKRNTTLAWFLFTVSNFCVMCFWGLLIVPQFIHFAYNGDAGDFTSCPTTLRDQNNNLLYDANRQCRLRQAAVAFSCTLVMIHATWFLIGLVQTIRHWKTIIVLDAAYPSKQMWLLFMVIEAVGLIVWTAGNLRLTYYGKDDITYWSNQILWNSTYMLTLLVIVCMVMTAYAILDASKLYVGITCMFHLCATLMLWSVLIWVCRWSLNPELTLVTAPGNSLVNANANRTVAAGVGIVTACETIFTIMFAIAYKVMPDLFLTQPNLTGPAAV